MPSLFAGTSTSEKGVVTDGPQSCLSVFLCPTPYQYASVNRGLEMGQIGSRGPNSGTSDKTKFTAQKVGKYEC